MRKILVFLMMVLIAFNAFAIPASPMPVTVNQPDGTEITYYVRGDERVHWNESLEGYSLMYNNEHFLCFAHKDANDDMFPSNIIFKGDDLTKYTAVERSVIENTPKKLRYSKQQIAIFKQVWDDENEKSRDVITTPVIGEKHVLVILAEFSNKSLIKTPAAFDSMMNVEGYNFNGSRGSVRDYFTEVSYGLVDFHVTVAGPVTLPNTVAYYANHTQEFARTTATLADALVDYSVFADETGKVPSFHIIFAGYGDESIDNGQQIWSHKSSFSLMAFDGVYLGKTYSCSPELVGGGGSTMATIGTPCHELTHTFGADDYYDTNYDASGGDFPGTGNWDLMAGGAHNGNGKSPAHIGMHQKILFGWVTPTVLNSYTEIVDMPNSAQNPVAYIININTVGEKYILENRQKVGFDNNVPGTGLLIYHIHRLAANGVINNTGPIQQCYIVAAGRTTATPGTTVSSYGNINGSNAAFPTSAKTVFSTETIPAMFTWSTVYPFLLNGKSVHDITKNTSTKTVSFVYDDGTMATVEEYVSKGFSIYPNPAVNKIEVRGQNLKNNNIEIYDIAGKLQRCTILYNSSQSGSSIDISQLKSGLYFLKLGSEVQKFIKQ